MIVAALHPVVWVVAVVAGVLIVANLALRFTTWRLNRRITRLERELAEHRAVIEEWTDADG